MTCYLCRECSAEPVFGWREEHGVWVCPKPGHRVLLPCPAGRPAASGGPYCDEHGGASRGLAEAERDWNWLAPESVGDAVAVQEAGCMQLRTDHAYVVVRPEHDRWLAWVGLGSHLVPVPRSDYVGCGRPKCRNCARGKFCGRRLHSFPDRDGALSDATAFWRARLSARIVEVSTARGGTLAWGIEVTPLADPVVLELVPGENAWDLAQMRTRIGSQGLGMFSGLRGTGEAI